MTTAERVKVTHMISRHTRDRVKALVEAGAAKDASSFIEEAVEAALEAQKWQQLELELTAFNDPHYAQQIATVGDDGLEDLAQALRHG